MTLVERGAAVWTVIRDEYPDEDFAGWSCLYHRDFEIDLADIQSDNSSSCNAEVETSLRVRSGDGVSIPVVVIDSTLAGRTSSLYELAAEFKDIGVARGAPHSNCVAEVLTSACQRNRLVAAFTQAVPPLSRVRCSASSEYRWQFGDCVVGVVQDSSLLQASEAMPLASADDAEDYRRRLDDLPRALLVERRIRLCMAEVNQRQDEKDISRDDLVVNGVPISGSNHGYEKALLALAGGLRAMVAAGEAWPCGTKERAAQILLSLLGRTSSGFATLQEALRLYGGSKAVMLAPDSAAAAPLEVMVLRDSVIGRAHTRFRILRADADDDPIGIIDGVFAFQLSYPSLCRLVVSSDAASPNTPSPWTEEVREGETVANGESWYTSVMGIFAA